MNRRNMVVIGSLLCIALASSALAIAFHAKPLDNWSQVDEFKKELPSKLQSTEGLKTNFDIAALAQQLSALRVNGMPVCAADEISAEQYIELSVVAEKVTAYPDVTLQLNALLDTENGLSDCQFRVLEAAFR